MCNFCGCSPRLCRCNTLLASQTITATGQRYICSVPVDPHCPKYVHKARSSLRMFHSVCCKSLYAKLTGAVPKCLRCRTMAKCRSSISVTLYGSSEDVGYIRTDSHDISATFQQTLQR